MTRENIDIGLKVCPHRTRRSAIMYRGGKPAELYSTSLHCLRHTEGHTATVQSRTPRRTVRLYKNTEFPAVTGR